MNGWLTLHPKVKAALVAVALVAIASASAAVNGSETWNAALVQIVSAAFIAATAYLKSA